MGAHDRCLGRPRRRPGGGGEEAEGVADGEDDEEGGDPGEVGPEPGRHGGSRRRRPRRRAWLHGHGTKEGALFCLRFVVRLESGHAASQSLTFIRRVGLDFYSRIRFWILYTYR